MSASADQSQVDNLEQAHSALSHGAWEVARTWFEEALDRQESPEAWEGVAIAAWWQNDAEAALPARRRAYRLYRQRDDRRGAARVAAFHALDYHSLRDEPAIANGWLRRARRLLDGLEPAPEHAILLLWEGHIALSVRKDTDLARRLSTRALNIAASIGAIDWEMFALALDGLAMVIDGEIDEGMCRLDEAATAAVAGELSDLDAIGTICCYLIMACERVRDFARAAEWCDMVRRVSARWSYRLLFSLCRSHYAGVLIGKGAWTEAEEVLTDVISELEAIHPAMSAEGLVRLAELRRRQGRLDEADDLFRQVEDQPLRWLAREYTLLGRAALALEQSDPQRAVDLAERFLRGLEPGSQVERATGLELLARAQAALGHEVTTVERTLIQLQTLSDDVDSPVLLGSTRYTQGVIAASKGDLVTAQRQLEDAVDSFVLSGSPYENGLARLELAGVLSMLGRDGPAREEAARALRQLNEIGAEAGAQRARMLLAQLNGTERSCTVAPTVPVTKRELQILRLVAEGLTNKEIADHLGLSVHTVHRHLANVRIKLDVPTRAAAAAHATRLDLL